MKSKKLERKISNLEKEINLIKSKVIEIDNIIKPYREEEELKRLKQRVSFLENKKQIAQKEKEIEERLKKKL